MSRPSEAFEMSHHLVALLYVLIVALNGVIVVLQPVLPASYRYPEHEPCDPVKIPVEGSPILPELVANERYQFALFRRLVSLPLKNFVNLRSYGLFEAHEEIVEFQ